MNFIDKEVEAYAENHTEAHSALAGEIHDWTVQNTDLPQMLSGSLQTAVLRMLLRISNAKRVLEIGMFTGYSALTMAEVLPDDGELITLDIEAERGKIAQEFFDKSPHGSKIRIIIGAALDIIPRLTGEFDFVYIDADKENYPNYYEAVMPIVSQGGIIVADNVIWSGGVLNPESEADIALVKFNETLQQDPRVTNVMLTVRDGLMVARKN